MQKRIVILTGSGAAIPWKAPTTKEITKKLIYDKTFKTIKGKPAGEFIYNILEKSYGFINSAESENNFDSPNFEGIIDIIEYLLDFFYGDKEIPIGPRGSISTQLFELTRDIEKQILDFDKIYKKERGGRYDYYIINNRSSGPIKFYEKETFLEKLLNRFIELIAGELSYSKWRVIRDKKNERINSSLKDFIEYYTSGNSIVRYYTVNYDRLAEFATGLNFFNGFTPHKFNLKKIIEDDDVMCHYNLHGSVFFKKDNYGWHCADCIQDPSISLYNSDKSQRGETLFESNITIGLNKLSNVLTAPWYHFYHKFYNDCWNADIIYSIGYSFSDIHINKAIDNFVGSGKGWLIIIDKIGDFTDNIERKDKIYQKIYKLKDIRFPNGSGNIFDMQYKEPDDKGWITDNNLKLKFYCNGFKKFLAQKQWEY